MLETLEYMAANFESFTKKNAFQGDKKETKSPPSEPIQLLRNVSLGDVHSALENKLAARHTPEIF